MCALLCSLSFREEALKRGETFREKKCVRVCARACMPVYCHCLVNEYCKTPLRSTYAFSGLATVQVLIFGGRTYFRGGGGGGYDKAG